MKDKMIDFLKSQHLCTVSTVTPEAKPEAAYVGFTCNQDLEIVIGTSNKSRKFANLQSNPSVAIVVADLNSEVQYEGKATNITFAEYDNLVADKIFDGLPNIDKYRNDPNQVFVRIKPTWIRFLDHTNGNATEEFTEFAS